MSVTLRSGALEATYLPELGMVCGSLMAEGEELLAQRGGPQAYAERGSTFGIPLLYPWANRLSGWDVQGVELPRDSPLVHVDGGTGLPIHGLLAATPYWRVVASDSASLAAELDFGAHPELLELLPFPHRIALVAKLTEARLSVALGVTPTGSQAVPISFGFHPYLRCERSAAEIELPVRQRAILDQRGLPTGEHEPVARGALDGPLGERTFDDCFDGLAAEPVFSVRDATRSISIEFVSEWRVAQVYAPAGSDFICFEPMTAPVDALRSAEGLRWVAPGERFTAEFAISIRSGRAGR